MSTIAARTFTQAFNDCRTLLLDESGLEFSDAFLLPFAAQVYSELESAFESEDIPFLEKFYGLTYVANATTIVTSSITDLYEPVELFQRLTTGDEWLPVRKVGSLPAPPPVLPSYLDEWWWAENELRTNGANVNLLILARVQKELAYPAAGSAVGFDDFYWCIVYGTAALAGIPTGRDALAEKYGALYERRKSAALGRRVQLQQGISTRPTPYR